MLCCKGRRTLPYLNARKSFNELNPLFVEKLRTDQLWTTQTTMDQTAYGPHSLGHTPQQDNGINQVWQKTLKED
jgi:hypothetical protein